MARRHRKTDEFLVWIRGYFLPFFVPRYVRGDPGGGGDDSCNSDMDVGDDLAKNGKERDTEENDDKGR